ARCPMVSRADTTERVAVSAGIVMWCEVETGDAGADAAEDLVRAGAKQLRQCGRIYPAVRTGADEDHLLAILHFWKFGNVDHDHVHVDRTEDWHHPVPDDHFPLAREGSPVAVRIADRQSRDTRRASSGKLPVVAHGRAGRDGL